MRDSGSRYLHGTSASEQNRLSRLNSLINSDCVAQIPIREGDRALDVGSGLGQMSATIARAVGPTGYLLGVEQNEDQLAIAHGMCKRDPLPNLEFRLGSATELPLEHHEVASFDLVHARFLLEHVTDPQSVVVEMSRALRPGGRIALLDDDHDVLRLWPSVPQWDLVWAAYMETYRRNGNDPEIGRKLVSLIHHAGLTPTGSTWIWFGSCAGSLDFAAYVDNMLGIVTTVAEEVADVLGSHEMLMDGFDAIRAWSSLPDASLWFSICCATGIKPLA